MQMQILDIIAKYSTDYYYTILLLDMVRIVVLILEI